MKRHPAHSSPSTRGLAPLLVLTGALLLSIPAGYNAWKFWQRIPLMATSAGALPVETRRDALQASLRAAPRQATEGFALQLAGHAFTGALVGLVGADRLAARIDDAVRIATDSQLGRLQQAAARMHELEKAGKPIASWWPALRAFLSGVEHAEFRHFEAALISRWSSAYESLGLGPGTSREFATAVVGDPHGPFLQFFVERIGRVIQEREQAGDVSAARTCRAVRNQLLKNWTLEPGPAGLRLLAADLLADALESDSTKPTAEAQAIVDDLRSWRAAYLREAARRPPAVLSPLSRPALAPREHERLVTRAALVTWTAAATLVVAIVAILLSGAWLGRGRNALGNRELLARSALAAIVLLAAGVAWIHLQPDSIRSDFRADFSSLRYSCLHPLYAAGLALPIVLLVAIPLGASKPRKRSTLARLAAVAAGTWLILVLVLWTGAVAGELARRDYERATRAACDDPIAAMAGTAAQGKLDALKKWTP